MMIPDTPAEFIISVAKADGPAAVSFFILLIDKVLFYQTRYTAKYLPQTKYSYPMEAVFKNLWQELFLSSSLTANTLSFVMCHSPNNILINLDHPLQS